MLDNFSGSGLSEGLGLDNTDGSGLSEGLGLDMLGNSGGSGLSEGLGLDMLGNFGASGLSEGLGLDNFDSRGDPNSCINNIPTHRLSLISVSITSQHVAPLNLVKCKTHLLSFLCLCCPYTTRSIKRETVRVLG